MGTGPYGMKLPGCGWGGGSDWPLKSARHQDIKYLYQLNVSCAEKPVKYIPDPQTKDKSNIDGVMQNVLHVLKVQCLSFYLKIRL